MSRDTAGYITAELSQLLDVLQGSDIRELDIREGSFHVRIKRTQAEIVAGIEAEPPTEAAAESAREPTVYQVVSPVVGTFYRAGRAGDPPLVAAGSRVDEDTIVGIVEALQVLTEIEAGVTGTVVAVLTTDGQPIEYGQPLVEIKPDV